MTVDIYAPTAQDTLSAEELALYHLLMDYRAAEGLPAIPLSVGLTVTAGRHALDTAYNIQEPGLELPEGANLHSWSDAPYFADHSQPEVMWQAPQRLGTSYPGNGYEITAVGYSNIGDALEGWQGSPSHDPVIVNEGVWERVSWGAVGIGVEIPETPFGQYGGRVYHVWFGVEADPEGGPAIRGDARNNSLEGTAFADDIAAGDGADTLVGGSGNDVLIGGTSTTDRRDVIFGGDGDDTIDGGYGNDELRGDNGNDTMAGGYGADTVIGGNGNDVMTGSSFSDLLFGGDGMDFVNGGFGNDRVNGGAGADRFFHEGVAGHGSDWIQDFSHADGDTLVWGGGAARENQFQVNFATTRAGDDDVQEAFVIYRPTGQILWALVDGDSEDSLMLQLGSGTFDLLA